MELSKRAQASNPGSLQESGRRSPVPDLSCDWRTNPHKVLVQLGRGGLRRDSSGPLALDHLPQVAEGGDRMRENLHRWT